MYDALLPNVDRTKDIFVKISHVLINSKFFESEEIDNMLLIGLLITQLCVTLLQLSQGGELGSRSAQRLKQLMT
jgi:hypothetical protein